MSVVAEFSLDIPLLETVRERIPGVDIIIEQQAAGDTDTCITICWICCDDFTALEEALEDDASVVDAKQLSEVTDRARLYRLDLRSGLTTYWKRIDLDAVLLDARATDHSWDVRVRFPDREALVNYHQFCQKKGYTFSLTHLSRSGDPLSANEFGLTGTQCELLNAAYEQGYFDIPRRITMRDLAAQFDISSQAVSERLRRALSVLLEHTLDVESESAD